MKPQHAVTTRLSKCPCCQSSKSKKNAGGPKHGNSSARLEIKRQIRHAVREQKGEHDDAA